MKVVILNTWGGRAGKESLLSFFKKYKNNVDVFCLQEMWSGTNSVHDGSIASGRKICDGKIMTHGVQDISKVLNEHVGYFRPHFLNNYGLMIFVKKDIEVLEEGDIFVHKDRADVLKIPEGDVGHHARNLQYIKINFKGLPLVITNFHGLWNGMGKTDSEDRLNQSKNILNFLQSLNSEVVLAGDFNLLPETKSIKILEDYNLTNLIKKYDIKSTRTSFYDKNDKYADYIFLSQGVKENVFKVLPDEVSDHAAMYLDI